MQKQKELELHISPETLSNIEEMIKRNNYASNLPANNYSTVTRVLHWLELCDCSIISAWRKTKNREKNDSDNRELQESLRKGKYGVIKMRGYYPEKGNPFLTKIAFSQSILKKKREIFWGDKIFIRKL